MVFSTLKESVEAPFCDPLSVSIIPFPLPFLLVGLLLKDEGKIKLESVAVKVAVSVSEGVDPHGFKLTLDGRKGQIISSLRARVGGHPKRFLFTAKKPSIAAAP